MVRQSGVVTSPEPLPDDIAALKAALTAERAARQQAEARASGAEAMVAHLQAADRQAEARAVRAIARSAVASCSTSWSCSSRSWRRAPPRTKPPLSRQSSTRPRWAASPAGSRCGRPCRRICRASAWSIPAPSACPCCGGKLAKLGEDITETLEVVPRQWKVIQTVREKFTCRSCEKITQPPAPFHVIARGRAGASLLAMILYAKFGEHQPLNRQSESYAREGIDLDVSTLADWVGACTATLAPLIELIRRHVLAAERIHGDDTTVPVLAKRQDRSPAGCGPMSATIGRSAGRTRRRRSSIYSRNRNGEHPDRHLAGYAGILQADAYAGFGDLYDAKRRPEPITEAACWSHGRRKFFVLADTQQSARRAGVEAVRRIDAIFAIEREHQRLAAGRPAGSCARSASCRSSATSKDGCAPSAPGCRAMPRPPRPWITCSSAGRPSPASSTTAASA